MLPCMVHGPAGAAQACVAVQEGTGGAALRLDPGEQLLAWRCRPLQVVADWPALNGQP